MSIFDLDLDKFCYYSKNFTIKTELEYNYEQFSSKKKSEQAYVYVTTVFNEQTKLTVEMFSSVTEDGARANFNQLKTKHILDYDNLYVTSTSNKSKEKGSYDFTKGKRSLFGG